MMLLQVEKPEGRLIPVSRLTAKDAWQIPSLFRLVYGNEYLSSIVYHPEALAEKNKTGEIISFVWKESNEKISGYIALVKYTFADNTYELAQAVVDPKSRGKSVFNHLMEHALNFAEEVLCSNIIFAEPLTNHIFTQKPIFKAGFRDVGILYNYVPKEMIRHQTGRNHPVATLFSLKTPISSQHEHVYVPSVFEGIAKEIYRTVSVSRSLDIRIVPPPRGSLSSIRTQVDSRFGVCKVYADKIGEDFGEQMRLTEENMVKEGIRMIYIFLPMADSSITIQAERLVGSSYFFGGVLPCWGDCDMLLLQKSLDGELGDTIFTHSDMGQRLASWVNEQVANIHRRDGRNVLAMLDEARATGL